MPHSLESIRGNGDEESLLQQPNADRMASYGAIRAHHQNILSHDPFNEPSSRGSSDGDEATPMRASIAERRRRRMHRHHHAHSSHRLVPRLISRGNSSNSNSSSSSSSTNSNSPSGSRSSSVSNKRKRSRLDGDTSDDRVREADLVLPALDPSAEEVIASRPSPPSLEKWFARRSRVNFSTIRSKYRASRRIARDEQTEPDSLFRQVRQYFHWHPYISAIRNVLLSNQSIVLFVNVDLLVDLVFCAAYLVEMMQEFDVGLDPHWLYKWRSADHWLLCQCLTMWNLASFIMRIFLTGKPFSVLFSFRSFIELTTTIPFIVSNFIENGQYLYVPYFLRSWVLLLRIKSAMRIESNLQMNDKPVDLLKSKLIHLISMLVALLFNGMAAFQYCEATFGDVHYSILDSLYLVMVTLSTVGYGDITPKTEASRAVVVIIIATSLAVLPSLIGDVLATVRKRNDGGGHVDRGAMPFILIIGAFRQDQVNEILDGFLNREHADSHLNVVFLDINPPNEQLKLLERNSMWGNRIQILHGSVLDDKTLQRARARYAKAIFTLSDQHAPDPVKEDERNTVRFWSLYCYTVSHEVPIYAYNLSPSTAIYQMAATEVICVREFKQYLLAMNCRCRGASTLLTNLLHQRQPINRYDESWQAQYDDGSCNEIYTMEAPKCIVGLTFAHAAWIIFKECQVILFAIKTPTTTKRTVHGSLKNDLKEKYEHIVLLNPGNDYIIRKEDTCVFISESPSEIQDIHYLNHVYIRQAIFGIQNKHPRPMAPPPWAAPVGSSSSSIPSSTLPPVDALSTHPPKISGLHGSLESSHTTQTDPQSSNPDATRKNSPTRFKLSRLPSTRHALSTGSLALISRLSHSSTTGQTPAHNQFHPFASPSLFPMSYILEQPAKLSDVTVESAESLRGHILVCMHREVTNIFKFIYNLRSPQIKPSELQDIVFLCTSLPSENVFQLINMFPKVYFMVGSCRQPDDLLRAGVKYAKQIVVMSEKECNEQYERTSDSPAVMTSHLIDLILGHRRKDSYTIVNLLEKSNIRFMHLLQGKDVVEEIDVFYTPAYASGDVIADSLISNVLLSQTYYKRDIVSIIKALCGMPGPILDDEAQLHASTSELYNRSTQTPVLTSITMPIPFVGQTFAHLFDTLLLDHSVLALGLFRAPDEAMGNDLPFVYTNPVPSLILKATDMVYILATPGWCMPQPSQ